MPRTTAVLDNATNEITTTPAAGRRTGSQTAADLAFLARAMKAPALLDAADRLAERARPRDDDEEEIVVLRCSLELRGRQAAPCPARPYLTVQSREPAAESLDRCLSRRLTLRLRYDGSFWDALHGEERIGGRNCLLHRSRSTHRIPRAHLRPHVPRHSLRHRVTRPAQSAHVYPRPVAV